MTLALSNVTRALLNHTSAPEAQRALLQAGAPRVLAALEEVTRNPAHVLKLHRDGAALVVSLLHDATALARIQELDPRLETINALANNPHMTVTMDVPVAGELFPPGNPSLGEVAAWAEEHHAVTEEFFSWLVLASPDPVMLLTQYALGNIGGMCHPEVLLVLQHHEDVMSLETFFEQVPSRSHPFFFRFFSSIQGVFDAPLVEFFRRHQRPLPEKAVFAPGARALLLASKRPEDHASLLSGAPVGTPPDVDRFLSLSVELQTKALMCVPHEDHQQAYARVVEFSRDASFDYDPSPLLGKSYLDFPTRLNLMCWAGPGELLDHLYQARYDTPQLERVLLQTFSDLPQLTRSREWVDELDGRDESDSWTRDMVTLTLEHAPGLVPLALEYTYIEGLLTDAVRRGLQEYCGADTGRWESVLSLGPTWAGTFPELLECVGLTDRA